MAAVRALGALYGCAVVSSPAAELKRDTVAAFVRYIRNVEARIDAERTAGRSWLWAASAERRERLRAGGVAVERLGSASEWKVPDGLIHDWVGAVFIPGRGLDDTLPFVQDYDRHKQVYRPEVVDSRLISHNGDDFTVRLRMLKKKVLTVVLDTEHAVHYERAGPHAWRSRSYSTRILEVRDAGSPRERLLPEGTGHGFLWRLNSYWTLQEKDGGTYVECEAVSLTRNVPRGMGWLIDPIVRHLPRESLAHTLQATRDGVAARETPPRSRNPLPGPAVGNVAAPEKTLRFPDDFVTFGILAELE